MTTTQEFSCFFDKQWLYKHKTTGELGMYASDDELINASLEDTQFINRCTPNKYHEDSPVLLYALGKNLVDSLYSDTDTEILTEDQLDDYIQLTDDEQDDFDEIPLYDVFFTIEYEEDDIPKEEEEEN